MGSECLIIVSLFDFLTKASALIYRLLAWMHRYGYCKKEPKYRTKWRENAQALHRLGKYKTHSDQNMKFERFRQCREMLKSYDAVTIEKCLQFLESAGVSDPFTSLYCAMREGISIPAIARIRITRFRLAG